MAWRHRLQVRFEMRFLLLGLIGLLGLGHATTGRAAVLFQSIPSLTATASDLGRCSACSGDKQVYDNFTLSASDTITEIDFAVSNISFSTQPITVGIYTLVDGLPGSDIFSATFSTYTATPTGHLTNVVDVFPVGWSLAAGSYDITFYNPTTLKLSDYQQSGRALYQAGVGFINGYSTAFELIGSPAVVPEPRSVSLIGLALLGLVALSRRRRPVTLPMAAERPTRHPA
jgi:hypothetical protein